MTAAADYGGFVLCVTITKMVNISGKCHADKRA